MENCPARTSDDRERITVKAFLAKIILTVVVLGLLVNDLGSVFLVRYEIGAIAREAAEAAYAERTRTPSYGFVLNAAQEAAALRGASVASLQLLPGHVRVTVDKSADTLVLHRLQLLRRFIQAEAVSQYPET